MLEERIGGRYAFNSVQLAGRYLDNKVDTLIDTVGTIRVGYVCRLCMVWYGTYLA